MSLVEQPRVACVQCPFCSRARIVDRRELIYARLRGTGSQFMSCDLVCFQAYRTELRDQLHWDLPWGHAS